jgi:hypothetical protein
MRRVRFLRCRTQCEALNSSTGVVRGKAEHWCRRLSLPVVRLFLKSTNMTSCCAPRLGGSHARCHCTWHGSSRVTGIGLVFLVVVARFLQQLYLFHCLFGTIPSPACYQTLERLREGRRHTQGRGDSRQLWEGVLAREGVARGGAWCGCGEEGRVVPGRDDIKNLPAVFVPLPIRMSNYEAVTMK